MGLEHMTRLDPQSCGSAVAAWIEEVGLKRAPEQIEVSPIEDRTFAAVTALDPGDVHPSRLKTDGRPLRVPLPRLLHAGWRAGACRGSPDRATHRGGAAIWKPPLLDPADYRRLKQEIAARTATAQHRNSSSSPAKANLPRCLALPVRCAGEVGWEKKTRPLATTEEESVSRKNLLKTAPQEWKTC
jgi:hypothetical protein